MDTEDKYLDDEFYVVMAGERPPERHRLTSRGSDDINEGAIQRPARDTHILGKKPPVDGWVTFFNPELLQKEKPYKHGTFPFRKEGTEGKWFAFPEGDEWNRHPIWKWKTSNGDRENITLRPSIGMRNSDRDITFHCYITDGEIKWL